jgi:1-deoxy-D-xylulose-5-phosphate synthase
MFDVGYLRLFPNLVVMAPGEERELQAMLEFALGHDGPVSIRYPKAAARPLERPLAPIELGRADTVARGADGVLIAFGSLLGACLEARAALRREGLDVGVINARFAKPLDTETILRAIEQAPFAVTVEESALQTGFGSAVLEAANDAGVSAVHVRRLGIPDRFIEHGERGELLDALGLSGERIAATCRNLAAQAGVYGETAADRRRVS